MLSARVRDQLRGTLDLWGKPSGVAGRLQAASGGLKLAFGATLGAYLLVKLIGVVVDLPPLVDLAAVPAGVCALGLAVSGRGAKAREETEVSTGVQQAIRSGLLAGAALAVFSIVYLTVNTVPMISSQDESAIVLSGHALATRGSLQVTSPLNDRYHTNVIGALHVMYRTSTEMYYRTFPGTAVLYAPFSVLPDSAGYRLFTAVFGTIAIIALYLVAWKLLRSWWGGLAAALVFAVSPAFGHWAVTVFNNVPVLALELCALAVVVWAPRERTWLFGLAGAVMSLAFFARITELVYVLPMMALVFWRARAWRPLAAFGAAGLAGIALIAITNQIFYGDALFLPHVGSSYIYLAPGSQPPPSDVLLDRYAQFTTGATESASNFSWLAKIDHEWFHVRYLASSTFAFPLLPLAFTGLAWRVVAGKRDVWVPIGALITAVIAVLAIYGQGSHNYYGFGQPIVRSSFVRYSLPVYALLAVAAGAFLLDARRLIRGGTAWAFSAALIGIVVIVGVATSYDSDVYGFNRVNGLRQDDRAAWSDIESYLDRSPGHPLVIGGPSSEKLIDSKYELSYINFHVLPPILRYGVLIPVAQQAAAERDVYLITSDSSEEDKQLQTAFYTLYRPQQVLHTGHFRLHRLRLDPANYTLQYVDVWNTYAALDRWSVTADGYLKTTVDTSYAQLPAALDADRDGRFDHDVTIELELLDAGPKKAVVSGLDSREDWRPVTLWSGDLGQTGTWRTATVVMEKGAFLRNQIVVSPDVTLRSIKVVAVGTD